MASYIYWIATASLCALYLASAATYVVKRAWVRDTILRFGYPAYLVRALVVVKLAAVIAILWRPSALLGDLAYAGMIYHLLLSAAAHIGVRRPGGAAPAIVGLLLLAASFSTQNAARDPFSPYAPAPAALSSTRN